MFDPELFVKISLLEWYKVFDNILYKLRTIHQCDSIEHNTLAYMHSPL